MTEAIKAQDQLYQAPQSTGLPASSDAAQPNIREEQVIVNDRSTTHTAVAVQVLL
jgi:hypothetical protein